MMNVRNVFFRIQGNVFKKVRGKKPYLNTATTDKAAQKAYLGFYKPYCPNN
jgi:hypothetical protein